MPSFTKEAILKAFLNIAAKKPLEKITVRDIVDECGVNRNTFYYYFQDIYAVLEELCRLGLEAVPQDRGLGETVKLLYLQWSSFAAQAPRAMRSIMISLGADGADRYFAPMLNEVLLTALLCDGTGKHLPRETQRLTVEFVRHALIGICTGMVREKYPLEPTEQARHLQELVEAMLYGLGTPNEKNGGLLSQGGENV